jgi:uncharacterized membrane protein
MAKAYDRSGYHPTGTMTGMDDMAYVEPDPEKAERSLWRRVLWTLLGMVVTFIVFAVILTSATAG